MTCDQSAVIPYQIRNEKFEVLLITSRKRKRWIIPKGSIDDDLTPSESAQKEAFEEAGVLGQVSGFPFGKYKYHSGRNQDGKEHKVEVFLLDVKIMLRDWPEANERARKWFSAEEAADLVEVDKLSKMLRWLQLDSTQTFVNHQN